MSVSIDTIVCGICNRLPAVAGMNLTHCTVELNEGGFLADPDPDFVLGGSGVIYFSRVPMYDDVDLKNASVLSFTYREATEGMVLTVLSSVIPQYGAGEYFIL